MRPVLPSNRDDVLVTTQHEWLLPATLAIVTLCHEAYNRPGPGRSVIRRYVSPCLVMPASGTGDQTSFFAPDPFVYARFSRHRSAVILLRGGSASYS